MNGKAVRVLLVAVLVLALLITLKEFLIPVLYGFLLAIIVYPVCKKLEKKGVPSALAIAMSVSIIVVILGLIAFVFILQVRALNKDLPELTNRLIHWLANTQAWLTNTFGISIKAQTNLVKDMIGSLGSNAGALVRGSFSVASAAIIFLIIVPIYTVLILAYRRILVDFLDWVVGSKYNGDLSGILAEVIHNYFRFIRGMFFVYLIVGVLNSIGLLALGVDHAILFGMVTAFMTIIPYIGIMVSSLLPITVVWAETNNALYPLGVVAVFAFVQYLEANVIFPWVVGKQIDVNTLVSLMTILFGGMLWGVHGMILFLPFVAFTKIIAGHFEELKPLHDFLKVPVKRKRR